MYELRVQTHFSAAHRLPGYAGSCANVHGHNWTVDVFIRGSGLDASGMLMDFRLLRQHVAGAIEHLDHTDLNNLPEFAQTPPTSEHIARHLFEAIGARIDNDLCRVHRITVWETAGAAASYQRSGD